MAKKRKKRVYNSLFGIPIWAITGISIFLIVSIMYDIFVGDRNMIRYMLLAGSSLILLISIGMHVVSISSIKRIASRQFGG